MTKLINVNNLTSNDLEPYHIELVMKISSLTIIPLLLTLIIISGCAKKDSSSASSASSSTTTGYTRQTMPAKTSVSLPSTLTSKASSGSRTAYAAMSSSLGAGQAQSSVMMMKYMLVNVELNMIIMDAAISQSKMSIGNCYAAGGIKVDFTAEMYQSLKDVFSKVDAEMSTSDQSTYSAMVGTEMGNDAFPVSFVTTTDRGFEKKLTLGSEGATCSGTAVSATDEVMMWTDNGSKLQYSFDYGTSSGGANFGTLAYDGATNTGSFDIYMKDSIFDGIFSGSFTICNSGTDDCVQFRSTMVDSSFKVETRGKADDNGGYALSKLIFGGIDYWIKEHWDTTLKSALYSLSCANYTWDNVSNCTMSGDMLSSAGETSSSTGLTSYETDAGKIFNQSWKSTPSKTSAFLADSVGQKYVLMTTAGSTNAYDIGGIGVKLDNSTVGYTIYFEPTNGDNLTMQDLSYSGTNTRSISSTAVDNLTLSY